MTHPEPEVLLRFADGDDVDAAADAHIRACADCQEKLDELARFEAQIAVRTPAMRSERERMALAAARLLASAPRARATSGRAWAWLGIVAAAVLASLLFWRRNDGGCVAHVRRYAPAEVVRGARERFQLDVELGAPRWLALWRVDANGKAERLLPNADPLLRYLGASMPLAAGRHRVPATELLDFAVPGDAAPAALLLVPSAAELSDGELAAIEALVASTPAELRASSLAARHASAQWLAFPAR